jgi:thiol:disulfide interchange protein DsbA
MIKKIMLGVLSLWISYNTFALKPIKLGIDYTVIDNKIKIATNQPINVKEFFSFTCIHCKELEPLLDKYQLKNARKINLQRIHIVFGDDKTMTNLAKLNETIVLLGKSKDLNPLVFDAIFARTNLTDVDVLKQFLQQNKVDVKQFMNYYNSFDIAQKVAKDKQLTMDSRYNLSATPTIIVADKYIINSALPNRLIEVLDYLVKLPNK